MAKQKEQPETDTLAETRPSRKRKESTHDDPGLSDKLVIGVFIAAVLILFNGFQLISVASLLTGGSGATSTIISMVKPSGSVSLAGRETIAPALTELINQPAVLPGYKTRMIKMETISDIPVKPKTGDAVQDAINAVVPTGTPAYGAEAGVSFDDPIGSQRKWATYERSIQLTPELDARWQKIVGSFTCDYCCGSPQNPTIINRCGCSHAAAWRGMSKWFLSKYATMYSDSQIIGEMSRWKALWYPGPTVKRAFEEGVL